MNLRTARKIALHHPAVPGIGWQHGGWPIGCGSDMHCRRGGIDAMNRITNLRQWSRRCDPLDRIVRANTDLEFVAALINCGCNDQSFKTMWERALQIKQRAMAELAERGEK